MITLGFLALLLSGAPSEARPAFPDWPMPPVIYSPKERMVSNWRSQGLMHLEVPWLVRAGIALGDQTGVTRCVRLNNYWCIKRAGWAGEIASDAEGHVAFSSALEGATVAAQLLRRYYGDYGRHSALAIISRWAPSECGFGAAARGRPRAGATAQADRLAVRGIGQTLRARFLASRGRGGTRNAKATPLRRSVVAMRPLPLMRAPSIAVGLGEQDIRLGAMALGTVGLAALAPSATGKGAAPATSCFGDGARVAAYAEKAARGAAASQTDDLHLFDDRGRPLPALAQVMHNMSAVEIGPFGASRPLIEQAIDRAFPASGAAPP